MYGMGAICKEIDVGRASITVDAETRQLILPWKSMRALEQLFARIQGFDFGWYVPNVLLLTGRSSCYRIDVMTAWSSLSAGDDSLHGWLEICYV